MLFTPPRPVSPAPGGLICALAGITQQAKRTTKANLDADIASTSRSAGVNITEGVAGSPINAPEWIELRTLEPQLADEIDIAGRTSLIGDQAKCG